MEILGYLYGAVAYESECLSGSDGDRSDATSEIRGEPEHPTASVKQGRSPNSQRSTAPNSTLWRMSLLSMTTLMCSLALMAGTADQAAALMRFGSQGADVTQLQQELTVRGFYSGPVTGYYGELTQEAVRRFQRANGLVIDGIAGPNTLATLRNSASFRPGSRFTPQSVPPTPQMAPQPSPTFQDPFFPPSTEVVSRRPFVPNRVPTQPTFPPTGFNVGGSSAAGQVLYRGDTGQAVFQLQQDLTRAGVYRGPITGYYGALTENAVTRFQRLSGIEPTGVTGPVTLQLLQTTIQPI